MKLSLEDRVYIRKIYKPTHLGLIKGDIWDELDKQMAFTAKERKDFEIEELKGGGINWNKKGDGYTSEIVITDEQARILKNAVRDLDQIDRIPNFPEIRDLGRRILAL